MGEGTPDLFYFVGVAHNANTPTSHCSSALGPSLVLDGGSSCKAEPSASFNLSTAQPSASLGDETLVASFS